MFRSGNHIDNAITQIDVSHAIRLCIKAKERLHTFQIERDNLDVRQGRELRIAIAMVRVSMCVNHKHRNLGISSSWQQIEYRSLYRHLCGVRQGAGIDQQRFFGSDEQKKNPSALTQRFCR